MAVTISEQQAVHQPSDIEPYATAADTTHEGSKRNSSTSGTPSGNEGKALETVLVEPSESRNDASSDTSKRSWFAYVKTRDFWLVLLLG
jgi:hypothetical protein